MYVTIFPASPVVGDTDFERVTVGFRTFTTIPEAAEVEEYVKVPLLL